MSDGGTQEGSPACYWIQVLNPKGSDDSRQIRSPILKGGRPVWEEVGEPKLPRKASSKIHVPVPQTDTGRRVEHTKEIGRTLVKEFGKIDP